MQVKSLLRGILVLSVFVMAGAAQAQATRTWVSGVGDDANPCSRTAPCKTWAGAISKTAAGGEIDALDPGGFGTVTITKAITLDAHYTMGSVLASGTNAINVAAAATDVVTLRGLNLTSVPPSGLTALSVTGAVGAVHVEDCAIYSFTTGINFAPTTPAALYVKNTVISDSKTAGITLSASVATPVTIDKSQLFNDVIGLSANASAKVSIHDSVIAGNTTSGVTTVAGAEVNVDHGLIANNGVGVQADGTVRLSDVMVSNNTTGVTGGGTLASFGNNRIAAGNGTNGSPTSAIPQQ